MSRDERTEITTTVTHVAEPLASKGRENGPHLTDLRAFVLECDGLPGSVVVHIRKGGMNESGRHDVTLSATWRRPADESEAR